MDFLVNTWIAKMRGLFFPLADQADGEKDRSVYERFEIPFTFKPHLSFVEALIATAGALLRIFLGSLLFAVWGTYSLVAWSAIRNPFWRVGTQLPLLVLFLLSFCLLMLAIAALVRTISRRVR
jgi:hypothetical protein